MRARESTRAFGSFLKPRKSERDPIRAPLVDETMDLNQLIGRARQLCPEAFEFLDVCLIGLRRQRVEVIEQMLDID
jgi:hypothetical protein